MGTGGGCSTGYRHDDYYGDGVRRMMSRVGRGACGITTVDEKVLGGVGVRVRRCHGAVRVRGAGLRGILEWYVSIREDIGGRVGGGRGGDVWG